MKCIIRIFFIFHQIEYMYKHRVKKKYTNYTGKMICLQKCDRVAPMHCVVLPVFVQ